MGNPLSTGETSSRYWGSLLYWVTNKDATIGAREHPPFVGGWGQKVVSGTTVKRRLDEN